MIQNIDKQKIEGEREGRREEKRDRDAETEIK